jgi:diguanylate cyclase (GGDEF)-like protein
MPRLLWRYVRDFLDRLASAAGLAVRALRPPRLPGPASRTAVFSAYAGGVIVGLSGALLLLLYIDFSASSRLLSTDPVRFSIVIAAILGVIVMIGLWHENAKERVMLRETDVRLRAQAMTTELIALRAILDDVDYGVVVLDQDRRAQFINRAFRRTWRVPDAVAESNPPFVKLMYHGRGMAAYAVSPDQMGDYVARQMALIRTGEHRPLNIRLANGEVLQFRCKALPGGGRLLSYGDVSDLVHRADTLERLASIDGMTGLYNRRRFLALVQSEWSRFKRYGRPLSMLMVDIDLFKSVNDRYGHDVGDEVIKTIADILEKNKRSSDIAGRLGGEEFALLLPEATLDQACIAGERFRRLVAESAVAANGHTILVTVSVGISCAHKDMSGIDELMKQADLALYDAKHAGRNRVCQFKPPAHSDNQAGGPHDAGTVDDTVVKATVQSH